jgi:PAS domain S-box-containing protein
MQKSTKPSAIPHYLEEEFFHRLREDGSLFRFLQEGALDGLWYWDLERPSEEWMDEKFWHTLGYDPSKMSHSPASWQGIIDKEDFEKAGRLISRAIENPGFHYDQVVRYTHANGRKMFIRCRGLVIRDPHGRPIRMLGAHNDITDLKERERDLNQLNRQLEHLVSNMGDLVVVLDEKHHVQRLFVQPPAGFMVRNSQAVGIDIQQVIADEVLSLKLHLLIDQVHQSQHKMYRDFELGRSGKTFRFLATPLPEKDDKSVGIVLTGWDISAQLALETTLKKVEIELAYFFTASVDLLCIADHSGRFVKVNPAWERTLGYSMESLTHARFADFIHPDDLDPTASVMRQLQEGLEVIDFVNRYRTKQGKWRHFEWRAGVKHGLIFAVARDVTDRLEVAEELARKNAELEHIKMTLEAAAALAQVGSWSYTPSNELVYLDTQSRRMLGLLPDEDVRFQDFPPGDFSLREILSKELRSLVKSGGVLKRSFSLTTLDERTIWVDFFAEARMSGRVCSEIIGAIRDVTHEWQTAQHLAASEEKHRTLFEVMRQGVVYQNAKGEIIDANPAALEILGLTEDQLFGRTSFHPEWRAVYPDGRPFPGHEHPAMVALQKGRKVDNVIMGVYHPHEAQYRWINIHAIPLFRAGEHKPYQVYATFEDVTQSVEAQQKIKEEQEKLSFTLRETGIGIWELFLPSGKLVWDPYLKKMLGIPLDMELTFSFWQTMIHPEDKPMVEERFQAFLQKDEPYDIIFRINTLNGDTRFHEAKAIKVKGGNGTEQVIGITRDVTDRLQREDEIRRSQTLQEVSKHVPGAIFQMKKVPGEPFRFTFVSESIVKMTGIEAACLLNDATPFFERIDKKDVERFRQQLDTAPESEEQRVFEFRLLSEDSSWMWFRVLATLTRQADKVRIWNGYIKDVTEQKHAEFALEKELAFQTMVSALSESMLNAEDKDLEKGLQHILQVMASFFGAEDARILVNHLSITDEDLEVTYQCPTEEWSFLPVLKAWAPSFKTFEGLSYLTLNAQSKGLPNAVKEWVDLRKSKTVFISPLIFEGQHIGKLILGYPSHGLLMEPRIFAQKKVVLEILGSALGKSIVSLQNKQFKVMFDHANFGMLIMNLNCQIFYVNDYMAIRHGRTKEELVGANCELFFAPSQQKRVQTMLEWVHKEGQIQLEEFRHIHSDGHEFSMLVNAIRLPAGLSEVQLVAATFLDISDRKEKEIQLERSLDLVSEQNKRLLNFSYIVSHNIRSHASNILGISDMLVHAKDAETKEEMIQYLHTVSNGLDETLRNLNELLQIQSKRDIQRKPIPLKRAILQTIDMVGMDIAKREAKVMVHVPEDLIIHWDQAYLDSILLNLLTNALRYAHPHRTPEITFTTTTLEDGFQLVVEDNGLGIDLSVHKNKLFGLYKTFHGNEDARGVGLFITKSQIEAMGGNIQVESTPGEGTKFLIFIPFSHETRLAGR